MAIELLPDNWQEVWSYSDESEVSGEYYFPMPDFQCPIIFTNRYVLVTALSTLASAKWRTAGYCSMIVNPGTTDFGINRAYVKSELMFFGKNLFVFPEISNSYNLNFGIKPWIRNITVGVYRYVGLVTETYDPILEQIRDAVT